MRVCVVTTAFPRWPGDGQAVFVWEAVRSLASQGVDMRVVAMHSPETAKHEVMDGIEVIRPQYWWPGQWESLRKEGAAGIPVAWKKHPLARIQILPFILIHALTAAQVARSCDLVHAQWTLSAGAACLGKPVHHRPIVATVQGSDIFQVPRHPLGKWLTQGVLRRCDRITALSRALEEVTISLGIDPNRIQTIPNGVDTSRFTPPADGDRAKVVLYVGTLIKRKGVRYLLEAMPRLFQSLPDYQLVLVGEGPEAPSLKLLADELGIGERVDFAGFLPPDEVRGQMQRARVLVLPSTEEGLGVVLLEAMACGTPVVGSRIDGIQEVITPDVGTLVPPADPVALSEAIGSVVGDRHRWEVISKRARERAVSQYDWHHIAGRFIELYHSLLT